MFTSRDIRFFTDIIQKAGTKARNLQKKGIHASRKDDRSIVTTADLEIQQLLEREIRRRYKNIRFIHEEGSHEAVNNIGEDDLIAIIDPIDGTAIYSMMLPTWCISIGIFRGYTPLHGFVYSPGCGMLFHNDADNAYLNGQPLLIDRNMEIEAETNVFLPPNLIKKCIIDFPGKVRNLGSTALHGCLVAASRETRTLAFFGKACLWDWAGAIPVIEKAGGSVRYVSGSAVDFENVIKNNCYFPEYLIAYAHHDFEMVRSLLQSPSGELR